MGMSQASLISGTTSNFFSGLKAEADEKLGAPLEASEAMSQTPFHHLLDTLEKEEALSSDSGLKLKKGTQVEKVLDKGADNTEKDKETNRLMASVDYVARTFDFSEIREVETGLTSFSTVNLMRTSHSGEGNMGIKEGLSQDEALPVGEEILSVSRATEEGNEEQAGHIRESDVRPGPDSTEAGVFPAVETRAESLTRTNVQEGHRLTPSPRQEGVEWQNRHQAFLSAPVVSGARFELEVKPLIPAQVFSEKGGRTQLEGASDFSKAPKILFQEKFLEYISGERAVKDGLGNIEIDHNDFQLQSEPENKLSNEILSRVERNRQGNFQQANAGGVAGVSSSLSDFSKPLLKKVERDFTGSKKASSETGSEKISDTNSEGLLFKREDEADGSMFRRRASSFSGRFPLPSPAESLSPESLEAENIEGRQVEIALKKAPLNGAEHLSGQRAIFQTPTPFSGPYAPIPSDEVLSTDPFGVEEIDGTQTESAPAKSSLEGTESPFDQRAILQQTAALSGRFSLIPPDEVLRSDSFVIEKVAEKQMDIAPTESSLDGVENLSDRREILRQVERHLRSWRPEDGTPIRLQLSPKRLGSLEIEMSIHEKSVSAHILTGDFFVKELLEGNQTFLREGLANQGLKMGQFSVALGGRGAQDFSQRGGESLFQKGSSPFHQHSRQAVLNDPIYPEKGSIGRVNVYI